MKRTSGCTNLATLDPSVPPQFSCEQCGGAMYPEYYRGVHGYEYKLLDVI
ncbi:hypothetical protein ACS127_03530 [Amphibacillus sp. Q70]